MSRTIKDTVGVKGGLTSWAPHALLKKAALARHNPDGEGQTPTRSSERVDSSRSIPGTTLVHGSGMG